jgi:hypothetical protein
MVSHNFKCNTEKMICEIGSGNMTLQECAESCRNTSQPTYGCVWNATQPQCVENAGSLSKENCESYCKPATYANCLQDVGICQTCDPNTDPSCIYTEDYCNASCHKSFEEGVWRGIMISQNYAAGEWDFTFHDEASVSFWLNNSQ